MSPRRIGWLLLGQRLVQGLVLATLAAGAAAAPAKPGAKPPGGPLIGRGEAVLQFAQGVAERQGLPLDTVLLQLAPARQVGAVRGLIMPPPQGTAKNWAAYRARFIEPQRIAAGLAFWQQAEPWLQQAEARWGVPPELVVGIVGVETFYGRVTGQFRALDALATLAFHFPSGRSDRSAFFRDELEALLALARREGQPVTQYLGSFAGTMGWPQFMPSSIERWGVDLDGDGRVRLHDSAADIVGSVAHYLAAHGWQRGMPTHHAVTPPPPGPGREALLAPDILPSFSAAQMQQHGAALDAAGQAHAGPLALVALENGEAPPSHVAGTENFYVVTRYNRSSYYALAVIELGQAVARAREAARR